MRLIDADALKQDLSRFYSGEVTARNLIDEQPTIIMQECKTGHWVGIDDEPCDVYECDCCGTTYDTCDSTWNVPNFCPNCGTRMEVERDGRPG